MSRNYTRDAHDNPARPATRGYSRTVELPTVLGEGRVREIAGRIADNLIEDARTTHGPVVWVTGNSYMPPFRSFGEAEYVWNADNNRDGELFTFLVEQVESKLQDAHVLMESPDWDNALYVVDLARWQFREDGGEDAEDLNDEWEPRTDG